MKILGVIPARYASSRLPGKPLADILGKPMVWWVYQAAKQSPLPASAGGGPFHARTRKGTGGHSPCTIL